MAAALAIGTATSAASGTGFISAWFAATGFGLGLAMPTMLNAALSALTPERSGSGSALMTAMRQVGATIGVAVLGTVLNSVYRSKLVLSGLPADATAVARSSVGTGVSVALRLRSPLLLDAVRAGYAGRRRHHALGVRGDRDHGRCARCPVPAAAPGRHRRRAGAGGRHSQR